MFLCGVCKVTVLTIPFCHTFEEEIKAQSLCSPHFACGQGIITSKVIWGSLWVTFNSLSPLHSLCLVYY